MPGSVEIDISGGGWGGDFSIGANGDLLLAQDTQTTTTATSERMTRLILTNPNLYDQSGNPISTADDMFNPYWGAGTRALVGEPVTEQLAQTLQSQILAAVARDPGIAKSPAPTVTITDLGGGLVLVDVSVTTLSGVLVTVPSIPLGAS